MSNSRILYRISLYIYIRYASIQTDPKDISRKKNEKNQPTIWNMDVQYPKFWREDIH